MDRAGALSYIMERYPDQREIWDDYLQEVEKIFPMKNLILLPVSGESE